MLVNMSNLWFQDCIKDETNMDISSSEEIYNLDCFCKELNEKDNLQNYFQQFEGSGTQMDQSYYLHRWVS